MLRTSPDPADSLAEQENLIDVMKVADHFDDVNGSYRSVLRIIMECAMLRLISRRLLCPVPKTSDSDSLTSA